MQPTTTPADPPLLDANKLGSLAVIGYPDYLELLGDLVREVPEQLTKLKRAIEQQSKDDLKTTAHSMLGILAYFGCLAMARRLAALEHGELPPASQAAAVELDLRGLWEASLAAIKEWEKSVPEFAV